MGDLSSMGHMTRRVVVLFWVVTAVISLNIDCSLPENQPKCKPRQGVASLPDSTAISSSIKDVVSAMDQLSGQGSGGGGGGASGKGQSPQLMNALNEANIQKTFVLDIMSSRQKEIDEVSKILITQSQKYTARCFALAKEFGDNATALVRDIRQAAKTDPSQVVAEQQKIMQSIEKLQRMRSDLEAGQFAQDSPKAALLRHSQLLAQTLNRAIRRGAVENDFDNGAISMLETTSDALDKTTRLLDEMIEELKYIRSLIREIATGDRETQEVNIEAMQQNMEAMVASVHFMRAEAIESLGNTRKLRAYLRDLTASQYESLEWYKMVQSNVKAAADMADAGARVAADATPLFDELLFLLTEGDKPYNRMAVSALNCSSREDACGVCGGQNLTCVSCDGIVASSAALDSCGVCSTRNATNSKCVYFCDGVPNSGKVLDMCGVCDGDDSTCTGCDNIINSGMVYDRCGTCGGDGSSCDKARECSSQECSKDKPKCPSGQTVTPNGYQGCCFDANVDCVPK